MKTTSKLLLISSLILASSNLFADESSIQGPMSKPQSRDHEGPYRQEKAQKIQEFIKSMDAVANDPGTPPELKKNLDEVTYYLKDKQDRKTQHLNRKIKDTTKGKEPMHVSRKVKANKINEIAKSVEKLLKDPKTSPELKSKLNTLDSHLEKAQKKMDTPKRFHKKYKNG